MGMSLGACCCVGITCATGEDVTLNFTAVHLWVVYPRQRDWEEPHMKRSLMQMFYWQVRLLFVSIELLITAHCHVQYLQLQKQIVCCVEYS